ncbi:MAG: hypothetical protein QXG00_04445 [Candidatus Woesearchaeota archaeon]
MKETNILVLSLFRDAGAYASDFLSSLIELERGTPQCNFEFAFYENDSVDNTVEILSNWERDCMLISEKKGFAKIPGGMIRERQKNLSYYRNTLMEKSIKDHHDWVVWINSDSIFDSNVLNELLSVNSWYNSDYDIIIEGKPHIISGLSYYRSTPTRLWDWGATRTLNNNYMKPPFPKPPYFPPLPKEKALIKRKTKTALYIYPPHFPGIKEQEMFDKGVAVQVLSTFHEVCLYDAEVFKSGCLFDGDEKEIEPSGVCKDALLKGLDRIVVTPRVKTYERM